MTKTHLRSLPTRNGETAIIELVIFDCDGVLVDSEKLAVKVDVEVLTKLGWPMTESEVIERFVGLSDAAFRAKVEDHLGARLAEDWDAEFQPLYRKTFEAELRPVEGVMEALDRIALATCVASNGTHEKMRFTLGLTGLLDRFRGRIFSATDVSRGKPAPDLFLHAAASMGAAPEACVVVEDSVSGVTAARAAGMKVLAYGAGVTPAEKLVGPGTTVFYRMSDLPELLAGAPR
ncbi:MAG: HAD family hydrolase [Trueperaceae bacterium]|nr:HAD family hydrolase [Trueperaceae bacterium]